MNQKKEFKAWYVKEMKKGEQGTKVTLLKNVVPMKTAYVLYWSLYLVALLIALCGITMTSNPIMVTFLSLACILLGFAIWVKHQMKESFLSSKMTSAATVSVEEAAAENDLANGEFNGNFEELEAAIEEAPKVPMSKAGEVIGNE